MKWLTVAENWKTPATTSNIRIEHPQSASPYYLPTAIIGNILDDALSCCVNSEYPCYIYYVRSDDEDLNLYNDVDLIRRLTLF